MTNYSPPHASSLLFVDENNFILGTILSFTIGIIIPTSLNRRFKISYTNYCIVFLRQILALLPKLQFS